MKEGDFVKLLNPSSWRTRRGSPEVYSEGTVVELITVDRGRVSCIRYGPDILYGTLNLAGFKPLGA